MWAALSVMFVSSISTPKVDPDIFHAMALCRVMLASGHMPAADPFAYTPTLSPIVHHEWGAGVIAYFTATRAGAAGIVVLRYLLAALMTALVLWVARRRTEWLTAALLPVAPLAILMVGSAFSPVRGHLYSMAAVAALLACLEHDREGGKRWLLVWFPLLAVWLNVHGGFTLGLMLLAVHAGEQWLRGRPWRHFIAIGAASFALIVVNPYGVSYYRYIWDALRMQRPGILEWRPLWASFPAYYAIAYGLAVLLTAALAWRAGWNKLPGIAILAATALFAALHQRFLPFFAIVFVAYVPGYVAAAPLGLRVARWCEFPPPLLQAAVTLAGVFFVAVCIVGRAGTLDIPAQGPAQDLVYPTGAVEYLARQHVHGNVMTPFEYGAYVSWKLFPAVRVGLDSRFEAAYPAWWSARAFAFYDARPGWERTLADYPTDIVMVRCIAPLARALSATAWRRVYRDGAYELYARPGLALPVEDLGERVVRVAFP